MSATHLRPLHGDDAADVLSAFAADPEMSRQGDVTDLESAEAYIRQLTNRSQDNLAFAVVDRGRCVGVVAINGSHQHQLGWFFYWVHPDTRGRGVMSQAAATVANWALGHGEDDDGGFYRLELGHRENNPASGRIAAAAGFLQEGLEREKFEVGGERVDVLTYGRLRSDPPAVVGHLPLRCQQDVTCR